MRIIDADTVVTIQVFDEMYEEYNLKTMTIAEALDLWTEEGCPSSVDAVAHVVRCKDCRHGQYDATHYFCSEHYHKVYADDFCSHGERQCNYFGERRKE